mmetsp:Transcript_28539/g.68003  ORF Transcript_28539/g.68003 Transcript_28539/m.68003 type:complete len:364 (-) Transcript_28539:714-1805(-)
MEASDVSELPHARRHAHCHGRAGRSAAFDEPRVLLDLRHRDPLQRVLVQHPGEEVAPRERQQAPGADFPVDLLGACGLRALLLVLELEGRVPGEEDREHDAEGPHVGRRGVPPAAPHLGRHERRRAAALAYGRVLGLPKGGEAKVRELELPAAARIGPEEVLKLDVSVDDPPLVAGEHGRRHPPHQVRGGRLGVAPVLLQVGRDRPPEVAADAVVDHEVHVCRVLEHVPELHRPRGAPHPLHGPDLLHEQALHPRVQQPLLLDLFACEDVAFFLVRHLVNHSKAAPPKFTPLLVLLGKISVLHLQQVVRLLQLECASAEVGPVHVPQPIQQLSEESLEAPVPKKALCAVNLFFAWPRLFREHV